MVADQLQDEVQELLLCLRKPLWFKIEEAALRVSNEFVLIDKILLFVEIAQACTAEDKNTDFDGSFSARRQFVSNNQKPKEADPPAKDSPLPRGRPVSLKT